MLQSEMKKPSMLFLRFSKPLHGVPHTEVHISTLVCSDFHIFFLQSYQVSPIPAFLRTLVFRKYKKIVTFTVPDRRRRIIPEVVLVRRGVIGVLGIWRGRETKGRQQGESKSKGSAPCTL